MTIRQERRIKILRDKVYHLENLIRKTTKKNQQKSNLILTTTIRELQELISNFYCIKDSMKENIKKTKRIISLQKKNLYFYHNRGVLR